MPVGERIRRQLEGKEIKEEQERLQCINAIKVTSRELNRKTLKEAEPLLKVLEETGLYEIFEDIRGTFNLEWERKFRKEQGGCLMLIPALIDSLRPITDRNYDITPAILGISIQEKSGPFLLIDRQEQADVGFGTGFGADPLLTEGEQGEIDIFESVKNASLEELEKRASYLASKEIVVENCSLKLKWGLEYIESGRGYPDTTTWNELVAEVTRDEESGAPFITIKGGSYRYKTASMTLSPSEWQDKKKLEDGVAKVYLQAFHE